MGDYALIKPFPYPVQAITRQRALELYDQAAARPDAQLRGSITEGFTFYLADNDGTGLVRCRVSPIAAPSIEQTSES